MDSKALEELQEKVKLVVQGLNTFHWNNGFIGFCLALNFDHESDYSREKYKTFSELIKNLNQFDVETLTKLINGAKWAKDEAN